MTVVVPTSWHVCGKPSARQHVGRFYAKNGTGSRPIKVQRADLADLAVEDLHLCLSAATLALFVA